MTAVVAFSGRIAIGKSSIANSLAENRGAESASFGALVRELAASRGLDASDRHVLQDLGEGLIAEHGYGWLCEELLRRSHWRRECDLLVDGVRHVEVLSQLRILVAPIRLIHVHLSLDSEELLYDRSQQRGLSNADRAKYEQHSTEKDVLDGLPQRADLLLSAANPVELLVQEINQFIDAM